MSNGVDLYRQFLTLHQNQLQTSVVPEHLWPTLFKKLVEGVSIYLFYCFFSNKINVLWATQCQMYLFLYFRSTIFSRILVLHSLKAFLGFLFFWAFWQYLLLLVWKHQFWMDPLFLQSKIEPHWFDQFRLQNVEQSVHLSL